MPYFKLILYKSSG